VAKAKIIISFFRACLKASSIDSIFHFFLIACLKKAQEILPVFFSLNA
jgi:hypothetical protein